MRGAASHAEVNDATRARHVMCRVERAASGDAVSAEEIRERAC